MFSSLRQHETPQPVGFSGSLLDNFDFETDCQFDTSFRFTVLSSNPTPSSSPSIHPSSTTSFPCASSQIPRLPTVNDFEHSSTAPTVDFAYANGSISSTNGGACGIGNDHYGAYNPNYSLDFLTDSSMKIQCQTTPASALQTPNGLLHRIPDYCRQVAHLSHPSDHLSTHYCPPIQQSTSVIGTHLQTLGSHNTNGHVPQPPHPGDPPVYDTPPGSIPGLRQQQTSLEAVELPDCNPDEQELKKLRRQRNSAAARKYRQRRLDRIEELEQALQKTQTERDGLKVQVARWKGKAEALQSLVSPDQGSTT